MSRLVPYCVNVDNERATATNSSGTRTGARHGWIDASASALGFVHQMRLALYELLVSVKRDGDESVRVTLETFDDVA